MILLSDDLIEKLRTGKIGIWTRDDTTETENAYDAIGRRVDHFKNIRGAFLFYWMEDGVLERTDSKAEAISKNIQWVTPQSFYLKNPTVEFNPDNVKITKKNNKQSNPTTQNGEVKVQGPDLSVRTGQRSRGIGLKCSRGEIACRTNRGKDKGRAIKG